MSIDDYGEIDYLAAQSEYEADLIDNAIAELAVENIRMYLTTYGDAIDERVSSAKEEAEQLLKAGHNGPALTVAVTAIEIILRFFVLRPIVHGAFLSEEWAQILLDRVVSGKTFNDRELLPK